MGFPKPLLQIGGKTFLEHILHNTFVRRAIHQSDSHRALSGRTGTTDTGFRTGCSESELSFGRTGSVQTGLRALPNDISGVMIFPVDCPIIPDRVLWQIYGHWQGADTISIPSYGMKRGHPPIIGATFFPEMMRMDEISRCVIFSGNIRMPYHVNVDTPLIDKHQYRKIMNA